MPNTKTHHQSPVVPSLLQFVTHLRSAVGQRLPAHWGQLRISIMGSCTSSTSSEAHSSHTSGVHGQQDKDWEQSTSHCKQRSGPWPPEEPECAQIYRTWWNASQSPEGIGWWSHQATLHDIWEVMAVKGKTAVTTCGSWEAKPTLHSPRLGMTLHPHNCSCASEAGEMLGTTSAGRPRAPQGS